MEPGAKGRITEGTQVAGTVSGWTRGQRLVLKWHAAPWASGKGTTVELRLVKGGTKVTLTHRGWGGAVGVKAELAGWFAGEVLAPLLKATAPMALGDWITDRRARRPSGAEARKAIPSSRGRLPRQSRWRHD